MMHQPDPARSSALSAEQTSAPTKRPPFWSRGIFWSIWGILFAILVALMLSCPFVFLLRWGQPGGAQTGLTQNGTPSGGDTSQSADSTTPTSSSGTPQDGDSSQSAGSTTPTSSSGTPQDGDSSQSADSITPTSSSGTPQDSDTSQSAGSITPTSSSGTPQDSDTSQSAGSITPTSSSGTPQDGDSSQSAGSITPTSSSGTPQNGDTSQSAGSITPTSSSGTSSDATPTPTLTPTPTPTVPAPSPTPRGPTPPPRRTPAPYTVVPPNLAPPPTPGPLPTNTPTATPTLNSAATRPASSRIQPPAGAPNLPGGLLTLIDPPSPDLPPSHGPTTFVWEWTGGPLPPEYGFEVRVWLTGEPPAGVHDAVEDNKIGRIEPIGPNRYRLKVGDIRYAKGVLGREGIYNWTVAIVQISPSYTDFGLQAVSTRFKYEPFRGGR